MTSKLKYEVYCPFCGEGLLFWGATGSMRKCPKCDNNLLGNKELWQALIKTKQDLEIALTAIKEIAEECGCLMAALKSTGFESVVETFDKNIRKKLEQIDHIADISKMVEHKEI